MNDIADPRDRLLQSAARRLKGYQRRLFQAEVCLVLCVGGARAAERRFGWGRENVARGMQELRTGIRCLENFRARGHRRSEEANPQLARDITAIVEPQSYADPELKSARRYSNLSAGEVLERLRTRGWKPENLPAERTMRGILNRMNFRLKRLQKGKPVKKLPETDAIFANLKKVREAARTDPQALEISMDTKAKVKIGDYSQGGKMSDGPSGRVAQGLGS